MAELKPGSRLKSTVCATQIMVIAAPAAGADLTCGGAPMVEMDEGGSGRFMLFTMTPSWLISVFVHMVVLIVLALFTVGGGSTRMVVTLMGRVLAPGALREH